MIEMKKSSFVSREIRISKVRSRSLVACLLVIGLLGSVMLVFASAGIGTASTVSGGPDSNPVQVFWTDVTSQPYKIIKRDGVTGDFIWAKKCESDAFNAVSCDPQGNAIAVGYMYPAPGNDSNIVVRKFGARDGSLLWRKVFYNGAGHDEATGVACDADGNPIVVGYLGDKSVNSSSASNAWMRKYRGSDGATLWTKTYDGGFKYVTADAAASDKNGNVYVVGNHEGIHEGAPQSWVMKLRDSDGSTVWTIDNNTQLQWLLYGPNDVSCDPEGNPIVVGGNYTTVVVGKLESVDGDKIWNTSYADLEAAQTDPRPSDVNSVSCDTQGNPIVVGHTILINKLNGSDGSLIWTASHPAPEAPYMESNIPLANGVFCDATGNPIVTGWIETLGAHNDEVIPWIGKFTGKDGSLVWDRSTSNGPYPTWYLAEGSTEWGFDTYISIENPNDSAVNADISYMTATGTKAGGTVSMPANSQATVNPRDVLGNQDFSTKVVCRESKNIAVDRTMSWTGTGAASPEGHSSIGVTSPSNDWYLPEGSSAWGFETWLLVQNPNSSEANCTLTYMKEGGLPVTKQAKLAPNSRASFSMVSDIGQADASISVSSDVPVIAERSMYRNNRREGTCSIGSTTIQSSEVFLAEGSTGYGFTTYLLLQNPGETTDVTVNYLDSSHTKIPPTTFQMPAISRKTIRVNDLFQNKDFSMTVTVGSEMIIAERAMYWDNGTGEAAHDSIGIPEAHNTFYLPDGETSRGRETFTLVENPSDASVKVEVSYLTPTGKDDVSFRDIIPAKTRRTYNMADRIKNGRAAIRVRSLTPDSMIIVERSMYWNNRGAGTDTIGGFSD